MQNAPPPRPTPPPKKQQLKFPLYLRVRLTAHHLKLNPRSAAVYYHFFSIDSFILSRNKNFQLSASEDIT